MTLALTALALPFLAFVLQALVPPLRRSGRGAAAVSIVCVGGSLAAAARLWLAPLGAPLVRRWEWIPADGGPLVTVGIYLDPTAQAMLVLVTLVAFLVQLYSLSYLREEPAPALGRYYTYQSLFAFSMLGLVLAPNFVEMFIFWELVGLCSYLLIGFWYERPAAARAAVKAFWTTRLGDVGFVIGIVLLWRATGTFDFEALFGLAEAGRLPAGLALTMFLIYLGAVGKSAQFPLHVWLPDAMEGPTPVSALIHAATMVAAGVFMVTRAFPLFAVVPEVLTIMAWVGAFTALLAATMACVENDIKRVLAYSTVSQLGYMMAAAGAAAPSAAFFHLLTHGVFKALLFLAAGAAIHAVGSSDIRQMGRLFGALPQTGIVFLIGTLALSGVWPFAGFFSKEAVLSAVWDGHLVGPFLMLALTALLTAAYMFRVVFVAFFGADRAGGHPHDAPPLMAIPLWVLGFLTVAIGVRVAVAGGETHHPRGWLTALSLGLAGAGIAVAFVTYQWRVISPAALARALRPFDWMARRRYGIDGAYAGIYRGIILGFAWLIGWIDRYVVDGLLNALSAGTLSAGDLLRRIQNGRAQDYVYGVACGLLALLVASQIWR
ncbi:MAG: NADH-quinone oxidoreductase subunit L [Candidatus Rokuibacteriota bacterium]|nr:MAG: NADH-quinone oxidoreductase subunit L [Candidatus Rokubacteria bacterium]